MSPQSPDDIEPELNAEARKQVRAFLHEMEHYYGIKPTEIHEMFEDIRWAKQHRQSFQKFGDWGAKTVVAMFMTGFVLAIWEGLKHFIGKGHP